VPQKPKVAVWKFASCDGCQLTLLDCEDELLALAGEVEIANFAEASRAIAKGPHDLSLVEGSITTPHDAERIHQIRRASKFLVTIGACATAGGIHPFSQVRGTPRPLGRAGTPWPGAPGPLTGPWAA
jgi:coenzyme F420-reducing hydrogenase gamma subunit